MNNIGTITVHENGEGLYRIRAYAEGMTIQGQNKMTGVFSFPSAYAPNTNSHHLVNQINHNMSLIIASDGKINLYNTSTVTTITIDLTHTYSRV